MRYVLFQMLHESIESQQVNTRESLQGSLQLKNMLILRMRLLSFVGTNCPTHESKLTDAFPTATYPLGRVCAIHPTLRTYQVEG